MNRIHPTPKENAQGENKMTLTCITWNLRGWGGRQDNIKRKMSKIKSEIEGYDIIILTETHLSKEENEIKQFEKYLQEYRLHHVHDKYKSSGRKGVTIGIKKNLIDEKDITITSDKGTEDEGRWIRAEIKTILDKPLCIWGIYAPTIAKDRRSWLKKIGDEIRKDEGYTMIAGDFNFVMDTSIDKRGGRTNRGTIGSTEQKKWEKEFNITDIWRKTNPRTIGTTWSNGVKNPRKRVQTRIDRVLADKRIQDRITDIEIIRTKISDHDAVIWTIETKLNKRKRPYDKIPVEMIKDPIYSTKVREIYEEEKNNGIEGYERFKIRCVKAAKTLAKKTKRKNKKNKQSIIKRIDEMRKILRWAESAVIQEEKGNKIKRRKRGIELITKSNPISWLGQTLEQPIELSNLEEKATTHLENLIDQRDELNERKIMIRKKLEAMKAIKEGERIQPSFFKQMKTNHTKEEIFALKEDNEDNTETREPVEIRKIAANLYKELWKNRKDTKEYSARKVQQLISKIKRKVSAELKAKGNEPLNIEEFKKITKLLLKNKSPGIDGIPAEFYQKYDFAVEWLFTIIEELRKKKHSQKQ